MTNQTALTASLLLYATRYQRLSLDILTVNFQTCHHHCYLIQCFLFQRGCPYFFIIGIWISIGCSTNSWHHKTNSTHACNNVSLRSPATPLQTQPLLYEANWAWRGNLFGTQLKQERHRRSRQTWYWASTQPKPVSLVTHNITVQMLSDHEQGKMETRQLNPLPPWKKICSRTSGYIKFWYFCCRQWKSTNGRTMSTSSLWSTSTWRHHEIYQSKSPTWHGMMTLQFHRIP